MRLFFEIMIIIIIYFIGFFIGFRSGIEALKDQFQELTTEFQNETEKALKEKENIEKSNHFKK